LNLCIPITEDRGLQSPVSAHFGSAPLFLVVDTDSGQCRAIPNTNHQHGHGGCQPLRALAGEPIDALAVGGIGLGAIMKLQAARVRVFLSGEPTVEQTLRALSAGELEEASPATACAHHGHGHQEGGCGGHS